MCWLFLPARTCAVPFCGVGLNFRPSYESMLGYSIVNQREPLLSALLSLGHQFKIYAFVYRSMLLYCQSFFESSLFFQK